MDLLPHRAFAHLYRSDGESPRGKLKWAGRAWASGTLFDREQPDELANDAELWGIELPEFIDQEDGVWAENVDAVLAFLSVSTQWRRTSVGLAGVYTEGLDYAGCRVGFELAGVEIAPDLWADLQLIELSAKVALNED